MSESNKPLEQFETREASTQEEATEVAVGNALYAQLKAEDFNYSPHAKIGQGDITDLLIANAVTVVIFATIYAWGASTVVANAKVSGVPAWTVVATVAWFAFCALLSGSLLRITLAYADELRALNARTAFLKKVQLLTQCSVQPADLADFMKQSGDLTPSGGSGGDAVPVPLAMLKTLEALTQALHGAKK